MSTKKSAGALGALGAIDNALETTKTTGIQNALMSLSKLAKVNSVEIDLPMLQCSAVVQPITGADDLLQRTLKASGYQFIKLFNKLLFTNTTFEGIAFEDLEDFEKHLSAPDKALLVYALLSATYTTLPEKMITCPHCDKKSDYTLQPSDMIQKDTLTKEWEHDVSFDEYTVTREIVEGFSIDFKMQTEESKLELIKNKTNKDMQDNVNQNGQLLTNIELISLYIDKLIIDDGNDSKEYSKVADILEIISNMPPELQSKLIEDNTVENFLDYNPNFYMKIKCKNNVCGKVFDWFDINPENDFFRKSVSIY